MKLGQFEATEEDLRNEGLFRSAAWNSTQKALVVLTEGLVDRICMGMSAPRGADGRNSYGNDTVPPIGNKFNAISMCFLLSVPFLGARSRDSGTPEKQAKSS